MAEANSYGLKGDGARKIVVDTHLHVYPWYDLGKTFGALEKNLTAIGGDATPAAVLTERSDCTLFADLRDGRAILPAPWRAAGTGESVSLIVSAAGKESFHLFAGRQIVAGEGIEILSLLADPPGLDGRPAAEVITAVTAAAGVPVLAWAPGKWFCRRGRVIRELTERFGPGKVLIGDTTLRPTLWAEPRLMKSARRRGVAVVAGSDPLPITGEEGYAGSYGTFLDGPFDASRPAESLRQLLRSPSAVKAPAGRRGGVVETLSRIYRNGRAKNKG